MRILALAVLTAAAALGADIRITYLANEGVLVASGSAKVLIDALFRDSLGDYQRHDSGTQERLESGKAPFDGVALALATHYHLDHWDAGAISRFLRLNPEAIFASTPHGTGMMPRSQRPRVRALWTGSEGRVEAAGVRVDAFPLHHGETQNLAFLVRLGDRVVAHLGDAEATPANFDALLTKDRPDVAMIPFWWLLDETGRKFVLERWKPRHVIAIHFGANDTAVSAPKVSKNAPLAWICTKPGESRTF